MSRRDPPRSTVPALILGGHLTGLGALRLLAARSVRASVIGAAPDDLVVRSRWYRSAPRDLTESADSDRLAAFLANLPGLSRAVLLPCTDNWALAVAGLPSDIRATFPASVPSRAVVESFVDKDRFRTLTADLGLASPRSIALHGVEDLDQVTDAELEHGFLKPVESQRFAARFEGKGFWVTDRADAARHIELARDAGVELILQEWIPGDASHNLHVDAFVDRHGTVAGLVARRKIRRQPWLLGNTASAVTVPLTDAPDAIADTHRIIEAVRHRGVFSAEFKYDSRDRRFKVLEVNARLFWYVTHAAAAGLDLAWLSYLDALELPVPRMSTYRSGVYGLFEVNDAAALRHAWRSGRRPIGRVVRPWLLGHRALFWWRDPAPAVAEIARHVRHRLGRWLRRRPEEAH